MLNIIDLFSGAGGLTEGFRNQAKFNLISHIEMDKSASETLKLRDAFYYLKKNNKLDLYKQYITGSVSKETLFSKIPKQVTSGVINEQIGSEKLDEIFERIDYNRNGLKIDGIIGGPPCQAYSTIGRAQNKKIKDKDERIYLYKYYIQFLERYQPDFFVFENVKGLLSFKDLDGKKLFPKIVSEFENVKGKNNYHVEFKMINCSEYGVPQTRERLIIFGQRLNKNNNIFFNILGKQKEVPPVINQLFKDLPKLHAGEVKNNYSNNKPVEFVSKYIRNLDFPLTQNIARPNNKSDLEIYRIVASEKKHNRNVHYSDLPKNLITHKRTNIFLDRFKAIKDDGYSHTVVAHIAKDGHYYIHPDENQNRSITVREAARIQTFPDDFYFEESRSAAFKQIGNAVPPRLSKKIAQSILECLY